jgi:hypothetical protein
MRELRRLSVHVVLLVVAAVAAIVKAQPEDESSRPLKPGEVELWGGSEKDLTKVTFESKAKTVVLERKQDDRGSYYLGHVEPGEAPAEPEPSDDAADAGPNPHAPSTPPKPVEPATFVSVTAAERIMKTLAPMRAQRAIGQITADREKVYGLDAPAGKLFIEIGGKKHTLIVGNATPGTSSRYVREEASGNVYVIVADAVRDMEGGASRLAERTVHGFQFADVDRAIVAADDKSRTIIQSGTEGRKFWADVNKPEVNDETAGNWLNKVRNLRPVDYLEALPENATKVARIEYEGKGDKLGFIEIYRYPGEEKDDFVITSDQLRLYATVAKTMGEQVADDLPSLFPTATEPEKKTP